MIDYKLISLIFKVTHPEIVLICIKCSFDPFFLLSMFCY